MKILVLGAGAVGGYFGGRMAEAGMDENGSPAMPTGDGEQEAAHSWSKSEL